MTEAADLHRLQSLDSEGDEKKERLLEIEAALGESERLKEARRAVERARESIKKWTLQQRDLELEIQGLGDKISRSEQRLYSGELKNPKELADRQAEVAALKRRKQKLEDDLLETMIEREEAEATGARAQETLSKMNADWSAQQADLTGEREKLQQELAEIERARAALLPKIDADDLAAYQALRRNKGGTVVVQMNDDVCGGCGVTVSPSLEWELRQEKLVKCGNCGRIIVRL